MDFLRVFFRGTPSGYVLKNFGGLHLFFVFIGILGVYFLVKNRENLRAKKLYRNIIIATLFIQQSVLYLWYLKSGYFSLQESLPFYNCRLAILALIVGEVLDKDKIRYIGMYWGLMGAILALLVPVLDPFGYDHYTFYSYFIGHLFLLWGSLYLIIVDEKKVSDQTLKSVCLFTNIYHTFIFVFDKFVGANYCYLVKSPVFKDQVGRAPQLVYTLIAILFFDLAIYLTHVFISFISSKLRGDYDEAGVEDSIIF